MSERMFPLQANGHACPSSVPWDMVAPFSAMFQTNHYQTMERIAERAGLSPTELWYVMNGRRWQGAVEITKEDAAAFVREKVKEYQDEPLKKQLATLRAFALKVSEANWNDTPGNTRSTLFNLMSEARKLMGNPIKPAPIFQDQALSPNGTEGGGNE